MKKKTDFNSSINQKIKDTFVKREVYCCFSYEMEAVLRASQDGKTDKEYPLPSYEDIENFYIDVCSECGDFVTDGKCGSCGSVDFENEAQDVLEWWIVSKWLYEKLKAKGHPVLEWGNNYYWGRCISGQAILLDGVISNICLEMKILEGQKNSWEKHI